MTLRKLLFPALALTALVATACGSGGSPSPAATTVTPSPATVVPTATSPAPTAVPTATAVPSPTPSALARLIEADAASRNNEQFARLLLAYVPDIEQTRAGFWLADYALAAHLLGLTRPDPADDAAVFQYVLDMGLAKPHVAPGLYLAGFNIRTNYYSSRQAARQYVGFAQGDITHSITVGDSDHALEIVFGDIDPEAVRELVMSCSSCPPPEHVSYAGLDYFSWGRDSERNLSNRYAAPLFDDAGVGGRLAVGDSVAWRTMRTDNMEALLAASAGDALSLADSADHVELLRVLLERQAFSVFISSKTVGRAEDPDGFANAMFPGIMTYAQAYGFTEQQLQQLKATVSSGTFPPPFDAYAVASAHDEDGFHTVVAYIYPSEELALAARPKVEQRFQEGRTVRREVPYSTYSPVVTVEGRTVLVRLDGDIAGALISDSEPVFAHE